MECSSKQLRVSISRITPLDVSSATAELYAASSAVLRLWSHSTPATCAIAPLYCSDDLPAMDCSRNGPQWALDCGVAHGALTMTTPGDSYMARLSEVESVMAGGSAGVQR